MTFSVTVRSTPNPDDKSYFECGNLLLLPEIDGNGKRTSHVVDINTLNKS